MKKTAALVFLIQLIFQHSYGQISGNQVYGNATNYNRNNNAKDYYITKNPQVYRNIMLKDSVFMFSAKVLMNSEADHYIVVFGVSEEDSTALQCNKGINKRIDRFKEALSKFGVKKEAIYVDLITQNIIYDYTLSTNDRGANAIQYAKGFEIKKNIIFKLDNIEQLDAITEAAANYNIFDIVKVDYIIEDHQALYNQLFEEAQKIINQKKVRFFANSDFALKDKVGYIISEKFDIILPQERYQKYQAYEANDVNIYSYNNARHFELIKKEMRKRNTFYYQRLHPSGFDKEINPNFVKVGVQTVYELKIQFDLR